MVSDHALIQPRRRRFRLRAPVAVAGARLRARRGQALLVVAGVAAAVAALAGVVGGSLVAQDKTLQRELGSLPSSERTFRVDAFGLPAGKSYAQADAQVRAALAPLTTQTPYRLTSFRTLNIDGELVRLAAVDGLPQIARLVSGRWPRECTPARCEVVQVGRGGSAVLNSGGIHLVRVGFADVPAAGVFGESLSTASPFAQARHTYLLLGNGAASFERLPAFTYFFRTYSWITPLDPSRLHIWQVGPILSRESSVQGVLERDGDIYQLTGPDAALKSARQDGHVASERMVIVGGEISALLLGFALVAAIGLRRGVWNESRRLSQRGARRTQVWLAVATEIGTMAFAGAVVGLVAGAIAVVLVSRAAGLPTGSILSHSLGTLTGVAILVGAWAVASVAIIVAVRAPERRRGRGIRMLDVAAIGAAAAVVVGVSSGNVSAGSLAAPSGERLLFTLLPGLVCFVGAVAAGRLLGPAMRLAERWTRNAGTAVHLAFLVTRPRACPDGRDRRLPARLDRPRALRRQLPRDARRRRARRGGLRRPARLHGHGGLPARAAPRGRTDLAVRHARARDDRLSDPAPHGGRGRRRHDDHLADRSRRPGGGAHEASLALGLLGPLARPDREARGRRRGRLAARCPDPGRGELARDDRAGEGDPGAVRARRAGSGGQPRHAAARRRALREHGG